MNGLDDSTFQITSLSQSIQDQPIGVNPTRPTFQVIYVGAPVNTWSVQKVGPNTFQLGVGGYSYVGVAGGKVIATIDASQAAIWKIEHQEYQNGYTVALAHNPSLGWTVALDGEGRQNIIIAPIIVTPSFPPKFLERQLFSFTPSQSD